MGKEQRIPASKVFAQRLRETRRNRDLNQTELAAMMSEAGRPLSKAGLLRIENGDRGISLDEAIALAFSLRAVPANLLSPPEGAVVELTAKAAVDGGGMRNWLVAGDPILAWPATPRDEDRDALAEILMRKVTYAATGMLDASRANDQAGMRAGLDAITNAIDKHRGALQQIEASKEDQ